MLQHPSTPLKSALAIPPASTPNWQENTSGTTGILAAAGQVPADVAGMILSPALQPRGLAAGTASTAMAVQVFGTPPF